MSYHSWGRYDTGMWHTHRLLDGPMHSPQDLNVDMLDANTMFAESANETWLCRYVDSLTPATRTDMVCDMCTERSLSRCH